MDQLYISAIEPLLFAILLLIHDCPAVDGSRAIINCNAFLIRGVFSRLNLGEEYARSYISWPSITKSHRNHCLFYYLTALSQSILILI